MTSLVIEPHDLILDTKPIGWIDNKFVSAVELFPEWITAPLVLEDFCDQTQDWDILPHPFNPSLLYSGLVYPLVVDEETGMTVPMYETFPSEDKVKVMAILDKLQLDYAPKFEQNILNKMTPYTREQMLQRIKRRELTVVRQGGRTILREMRFRLGVGFL